MPYMVEEKFEWTVLHETAVVQRRGVWQRKNIGANHKKLGKDSTAAWNFNRSRQRHQLGKGKHDRTDHGRESINCANVH